MFLGYRKIKTVEPKGESVPHFDRLETRSIVNRENALFRDLRAVLGIAKARSPALRAQLKNIPVELLKSRQELAQIPLLRREDVQKLQSVAPPLGGMNAARLATLKTLFHPRNGIVMADGHAKDWWGGARALYAAGFRQGDIVLNACAYHFEAEGHAMESAANAMGALVIPVGTEQLERQISILKSCPVTGYVGPKGHFSALVSHGVTFKNALILGKYPHTPAREPAIPQNTAVFQVYTSPEVGIVAYESPANHTLIVNEGLIVEIVDPNTGKALPRGEFGEIVVTRVKADLPLLRFATGDYAALACGPNPCGRTNLRLMFHHEASLKAVHGAHTLARRSDGASRLARGAGRCSPGDDHRQ